MRQHEQLGLGVGRSPDCRAGQPRVADLARVGDVAAVPRVARRPRPSLQIPEASGPDNDTAIYAVVQTVVQTNDRERHRAARVLPSQGGVNVARGPDLALRDRTPLVKGWVSCCRRYQTVDVAVLQRVETTWRTGEHKTLLLHRSQHVSSSLVGSI